jgi:hypothetical protein
MPAQSLPPHVTGAFDRNGFRELTMKDFSNAAFPPEMISVMQKALDGAVSTLPHPVSSLHVQSIAETILRTTRDGERDPKMLQTMALLELQLTDR